MSAPNQIVNVGTLAWRYANLCEDGVGSDEDGGGDPEGDAGLGRGEESDVGGEEQLLVHSQPGNDIPINTWKRNNFLQIIPEPEHDEGTARYSPGGGLLTQSHVCLRERGDLSSQSYS